MLGSPVHARTCLALQHPTGVAKAVISLIELIVGVWSVGAEGPLVFLAGLMSLLTRLRNPPDEFPDGGTDGGEAQRGARAKIIQYRKRETERETD